MRWLLTAGAVLAVAGTPRSAEACSCAPCLPGGITPSVVVPQNVPHLVLLQSHDFLQQDPLLVELWDLTAGQPVDIVMRPIEGELLPPHYFEVFPDTLEVDHQYDLRSDSACGSAGGPNHFAFTVTPPAPLPDTLGTLQLSPLQVGPIPFANSAACSLPEEAAYVDVEILLSDAAMPWGFALHYETLLDGQPWRHYEDSCAPHAARRALGYSWQGRGRDTVPILCEALGGPQLGPHTIQLRATIPGSNVVLTSNAVTVDFNCDAAPPPPPPPPPPADAGFADAGFADADSTPVDARTDDPQDDPQSDLLLTDDPSCGCSTGTRRAGPIWSLLLVLLCFGRRRR